MNEEKLNPIYTKVSVYELPDRKMPISNSWDIRVIEDIFFEKSSVSVGDTVNGSDGEKYKVEEVSFSFKVHLDENSKGVDSKQYGPIGSDNLTVKVYLRQI